VTVRPLRAVGSTSLEDVAALAEVSTTTVSRVLSGSKHAVAARTRDRVLAAAEELGYSASPLARALANQRSQIIGVIVPDNVDPVFAEIIRGIDDVANAAGYLTIICNAARDSNREIMQIQKLRDYNAAGVVFAGAGSHLNKAPGLVEIVETAQGEGMMVIALAQRDFASQFIGYDNAVAARELTHYLIQLGHRDIAFVSGLAGVYSAEARQAGYEQAMKAAGLPTRVVPGTYDVDSGTEAAVRLMSQGSLPDALIGANDQTAVAAMTAFRHAGITVPEGISVAGMGGTKLAKIVDLTTSAAPLHELGAKAAQRVITGPDEQADEILPCKILIRQTTRARQRS
jgi:LacI family transcriptional regulator